MLAVFPGTHLLALTVTVPRTACGGRARVRAWRELPRRGLFSRLWAGKPGGAGVVSAVGGASRRATLLAHTP